MTTTTTYRFVPRTHLTAEEWLGADTFVSLPPLREPLAQRKKLAFVVAHERRDECVMLLDQESSLARGVVPRVLQAPLEALNAPFERAALCALTIDDRAQYFELLDESGVGFAHGVDTGAEEFCGTEQVRERGLGLRAGRHRRFDARGKHGGRRTQSGFGAEPPSLLTRRNGRLCRVIVHFGDELGLGYRFEVTRINQCRTGGRHPFTFARRNVSGRYRLVTFLARGRQASLSREDCDSGAAVRRF